MLKVGILAAGGGTNLQAIIDAVERKKITDVELSFVLSNKPNVKALERAKRHGIKDIVVDMKSFESREAFERVLIDTIDAEKPDLIVLAGMMIMMPVELIRKYKNRIINVHPALIPSFCGKGFYGIHPHEAVLKSGVKVTGATVHFVDEIYDHGAIIMQKAVDVKNGDTPEVLQHRVMEEAEWKILPKTIDLIAHDKVQVVGGIAIVQE